MKLFSRKPEKNSFSFSLEDIIKLDKILSGEPSKQKHLIKRFEEEKGLKFIIKNGKWIEIYLLPNLKIRKETDGRATLYMRDENLREVVLMRAPLQAFFNEYALRTELVKKMRG